MQIPARLLAGLLAVSPPVFAEADPAAGRAVVVGGEESTVTPCFSCHGLDGAGDAAAGFPRLAGQAGFYLYKQLVDYASGARPNAIMTPIAQEMTEPQMQDVAAWYAGRNVSFELPESPPADLVNRGRWIAEARWPDAEPQPCAYCHGPLGIGMPPSFPYLRGQYAPYTELQLRLFRQKIRRNDPLGVMRAIAANLGDDDIRALAAYFAALPPEDTGGAGENPDEPAAR